MLARSSTTRTVSGAYWLARTCFRIPSFTGSGSLFTESVTRRIQKIEDQPVRILEFLGLKLDRLVLIDHDAGISAAGPVPDALHNAGAFLLSRSSDDRHGHRSDLRLRLLFLLLGDAQPRFRLAGPGAVGIGFDSFA